MAGYSHSFQVFADGNQCPDGWDCGSIYAVNLPDQAAVTAFRLWGYSTDPAPNLTPDLIRTSHNGGSIAMATVSSTDASMTPQDISIGYDTVDNANLTYSVKCTEDDASRPGRHLIIFAMRVDYTVNAPD